MSEFTTSTPLPTTHLNYTPTQNIVEQEMVIFEQSFEETDLLYTLAKDETPSKKRVAPVVDEASSKIREETLASMRATLLKAISTVCVHMIEHHREILKKQYKMAAEEMEAIQKKHA